MYRKVKNPFMSFAGFIIGLILVFIFCVAFSSPVNAGCSISIQVPLNGITFFYSSGNRRYNVRERVIINNIRVYRQSCNCRQNRHSHNRVYRQEGRVYYIDDRFNDVIVVPSGSRNRW